MTINSEIFICMQETVEAAFVGWLVYPCIDPSIADCVEHEFYGAL